MISVNPSFMKDLKLVDKKLDCFFHPGTERFIVTYERATGEPVPIANVAGMINGHFRQPYGTDLEFIRSGDLSNSDVNERMQRVSHHMEYERDMQRKRSKAEIRDRTKDDKVFLKNAFDKARNLGKGVTGFRQV